MKTKSRKKRAPGTHDPRGHSRLVVEGVKQAPSRAMLRAVGFGDADFARPQVGIASTWSNLTPCNMHIDDLSRHAASAVDQAGGKSVTFNTITVSDGISMGTPGMRYSLVSREVIADSIETVVGAQGFDGLIAIGGCDKNMPGCLMAIARLDRPAVFVYGGTIRPGGGRRDIVSVFEAVGGHAAGTVSDAQLLDIERTSIPGPGSCGGMYTANTMASAIEALGMSLPGSSAQEAVSDSKRADCRARGCGGDAADRARHSSRAHPHAPGLRERNHRGDRARWLDQCRAPPARDGACRAGAPGAQRLHAHRQAGAGARRSAPERQAPHVRNHRHRRHPAADAHAARCGTAARRRSHGHGQYARRGSRPGAGVSAGAVDRPSAVRSHQA